MIKKISAALTILAALFVSTVAFSSARAAARVQSECEVRTVMRYMDLPEGSFALAKGSMKRTEIETVLVPNKSMEAGKTYTVLLSRWANNVYRDERTKLALLTEFCTESATATRAALRFNGHDTGKLPAGKIIWP